MHVGFDLCANAGGSTRSVEFFAQALSEHGINVEVISYNYHCGNDWAPCNEQYISVPARRDSLGSRYAWPDGTNLARARAAVAAADIVFIHLIYRYHAIWAARIAAELGKPFVVVPHGALDPWVFTYRASQKKWWLWWHRELLARGVFLFATEPERRKALPALYRAPESRVISWPLARTVMERGLTQEREPSIDGRRRLCYVGRLHPMKRARETVVAFRNLAPPDWRLDLIGPVSPELSKEEIVAAAGLEIGRSIRYLGMKNRVELEEEYASADGLVLLSHRENFGHVVAEAAAFGLPLFISEDVDLSPLVAEYGAGKVFRVANQADCDAAMRAIVSTTDAERAAMSAAARRMAADHFSFERFSSQLYGLCHSLIG